MIIERGTYKTRALLALIFSVTVPAVAWSDALKGTFASPGMSMVVRFGKCEGSQNTTCGTLVWAWAGEDELSVPFGIVIAPALSQTETGWEGHLIDPDSGRTFRGTVIVTGSDELLLRGCAGPFCTTERWYSLASIQTVIEQLQRHGG